MDPTQWSFLFYLAGLMANLREEALKVDRFFWSDQKKSRCSSDATHWPDSIMDGGEY
jgi:hypothetical protein